MSTNIEGYIIMGLLVLTILVLSMYLWKLNRPEKPLLAMEPAPEEHPRWVKVNSTDYIDVRKIVAYSVYEITNRFDRPLYLVLEGFDNSRFGVNVFYLGNVIDYLYRNLGMGSDDYEYLDGLFQQAYAEEQNNNECAGEGCDCG